MIKQFKIDQVKELLLKLQSKKNIILTNYSGIPVKGLTDLRNQLRKSGIDYKVVKNNLFKKALKEANYSEVDDYLKGPLGVVFTDNDLGEAAKILKNFKKEYANFNYSLGIMDNVVYDGDQVKRIADIPSKEILISQIMSLINSPARGIAYVINQNIASVARAVKAVGEKSSN